jgi:ElaB/YqjD/DUF883 family membrane-anchored ribosome-binding protein
MATSTNRLQVHTSNGHDKRPTAAIKERAFEAVTDAASVAQVKIAAAAVTTEKVVKAHPLKSVGIALGGGILLGAVAARAFAHKTTLREAVNESLGLKRRVARMIQSWL